MLVGMKDVAVMTVEKIRNGSDEPFLIRGMDQENHRGLPGGQPLNDSYLISRQ
jgi:hypothetical protein